MRLILADFNCSFEIYVQNTIYLFVTPSLLRVGSCGWYNWLPRLSNMTIETKDDIVSINLCSLITNQSTTIWMHTNTGLEWNQYSSDIDSITSKPKTIYLIK